MVEEVKRKGDEADVTYAETHDSLVSDPEDATDHRIGYKGSGVRR